MFDNVSELHLWLVRFRVLAVAVTLFCCWLCYDAWIFYKLHYLELNTMDSVSGLGAFLIAFLGQLKFALTNVTQRHEGHNE